jgi:hypothetical protein
VLRLLAVEIIASSSFLINFNISQRKRNRLILKAAWQDFPRTALRMSKIAFYKLTKISDVLSPGLIISLWKSNHLGDGVNLL